MSRRCGIGCQEVQFRHFRIKLIRQEEDIVLAGLKNVFKLDTFIICLILGEDSGLRMERGKVKRRNFLVEQFRKEEDVVVVGLETTNSSIKPAAPEPGP